MSSSFPFGSGLLRELLKQTKAPKLSIGAQKWAEETESKHALDLIANPCVDFSPEETGQANQPDVNPFHAAAREYVATFPVHPAQEARIEDGRKNDEMLWGEFCNSTYIKRKAAEVSGYQEAFNNMFDQRLTESMARKLDAALLKTSASEVVAKYNQVQITRGDIAAILPISAMRSASSNSPKGWLNDSMIDIFQKIIAVSRNKRYRKQSTVAVNSFVVDKLFITHPKASAKRLGLDASTLPDIDLIFFPKNVGSHWMLIAAFPKTVSIARRFLEDWQNQPTHSSA